VVSKLYKGKSSEIWRLFARCIQVKASHPAELTITPKLALPLPAYPEW